MSPIGDWYEQPDGSWAYDESAPAPATDPTGLLPMVSPVEVLHGDGEPIGDRRLTSSPVMTSGTYGETGHGDVGDWIDPNAPDPTPDEITDPSHPDYVKPWRPAEKDYRDWYRSIGAEPA